MYVLFFFSSRRRHTILQGDWSSDVCSSDLGSAGAHVSEGPPGALQLDELRGMGRQLPRDHVGQRDLLEDLSVRLPCRDQIGRASCRENVERSVVVERET